MGTDENCSDGCLHLDVLHRVFDALHRVTRLFASVTDTDELLKSIVEIGQEAVGAEAGALLLYDPEREDLYFSVASGQHGDRKRLKQEVRLPLGTGVAGLSAKLRKSVNVSNAQEDERFYPFPDTITGIVTRSVIASPMVGHNELVGVIEVLNKRNGPEFTSTDVEVLEIFGQQAALAVQDMRLLQANVQAERLAAVGSAIETMSHATKNILARIVASSELIDHAIERQDGETLRAGWRVQKEAICKLETLVANMLAFGHMSHKLPVRLPCSIAEVIEEVVADHDLMFRNKSIEVKTHIEPIPEVVLDRNALRLVLVNLVTNAIDAVPDTCGNITLNLERAENGDGALVTVTDNGPGVPQNMLTQVFEPFFTTKGNRGNGLGLAVVKKIVGEHGWSVSVEAAKPTGASFRLVIPDNVQIS